LASLLAVVFSQSCPTFNGDCNRCSAENGCGFCYATQQCLSGTGTGPNVGHCYLGWMFDGLQCPNCSAITNCGDCNAQPDCGWCPADKTCILTSQINGSSCLLDHSCYCPKYLDCFSCNEQLGCSWCSAYQTCENVKYTSCSFLTHTCPACNNYTTCVECEIQSNCAWCVSGNNQSCTAFTNCTQTQQTITCDAACKLLTSCQSCTVQAGCGWCPSKGICVGLDSTDNVCKNNVVYACPNQIPSFSGASFVGGMFLVIGLGIVGAIFFFGYRYYKKRQQNYSEVI